MIARRFFLLAWMLISLTAGMAWAQERSHVVQRGETLTSIAKQYGVSLEALQRANPSVKSFISVGMTLTIPEGSTSYSSPEADEEKPVIAKKKKRALKAISRNHGKSAVTLRAFYIPISRGSGGGIQVSEIAGFPVGFGFSCWAASSDPYYLLDYSIFLTYSHRFYLFGDHLYVNPDSGLQYDWASARSNNLPGYSSFSNSGLSLRFNPTVGYQIIGGLSVEGGLMATVYKIRSFRINMTLGISYRF